MGNLIKDFWTYSYKNTKYFGIVEVIKGKDLGQNRANKKYENHIEKAFEYTMNNDVLSHMSIQTFCTPLKDRIDRTDDEQRYYPFVIEFEPDIKKGNVYNEAVFEAAKYVQYLHTQLAINKNDILIMANNSKSIYVFVNPKSYLAKPEKNLNEIYFEMYKKIKNDLGLTQVDEGIVSSRYKLMKTPNTFYKGGYFVRITPEELMKLLVGATKKEELTKNKRSLDIEVPGEISFKACSFYNNARKKIIYGTENDNSSENEDHGCGGKCTEYFLTHLIEKNYRNYGLVSVGIYLKSLGYTEEETYKNLVELAKSWNHDENNRKIMAKVNTIYRKNYRFSCKYAKAVFADLGIENMCSKCKFAKDQGKENTVEIHSAVINALWSKKGSTRHYLMYLDLLKRNLFNKNIILTEENINDRTLRELCKLTGFKRHKVEGVNNEVMIEYKPTGQAYRLTDEFIDVTANTLGEYLKHYLKMLIKGYRATEKYIIIKLSKENLMEELGYENISSVYKFLNKLTSLGLIKMHKTSIFTLYYRSFKVIEIQKEVETEVNQVAVNQVAVGEQISLKDINNRNSKNIKANDNKNINDMEIFKHTNYEVEALNEFKKENKSIIEKYKNLIIEKEKGGHYFKYKPQNLSEWINEIRNLKLSKKYVILNSKKYGYGDEIFYILDKLKNKI